MPRVKKQTAKPARRKRGESVVDRIVLVSEVSEGSKTLIYGLSKTGKTRLACTYPKPLLLIGAAGFGTEEGTKSVSNVKGVEFVGLEASEEIEALVAIDKYASYVLDTAGGLQERVVSEYTGHGPEVRKDWRHVSKGDWGPINSRTMETLRTLLDVADLRGKYCVIIAHERTFNTEAESADLLFPYVGASLTPGVAGWLDGVSDYIGQCFKREQVRMKQTKIAKSKSVSIEVKTGRVDYCLRVGDHPVYKTGFRVPVGTKLPDVIVDPSFDKIQKLIEQGG